MKTNKRALGCLSCLVLCALLLSSCMIVEPVQLTEAEINDLGELVLRYSNSTEQNLGVVVGKDGDDGSNGKDGVESSVMPSP